MESHDIKSATSYLKDAALAFLRAVDGSDLGEDAGKARTQLQVALLMLDSALNQEIAKHD